MSPGHRRAADVAAPDRAGRGARPAADLRRGTVRRRRASLHRAELRSVPRGAGDRPLYQRLRDGLATGRLPPRLAFKSDHGNVDRRLSTPAARWLRWVVWG